ncbi:MAG: virulence factor [Anaerolineales bacterium]
MARYRITYWKHIPQSFTVEGDGRVLKQELPQRVQNAIDACAMAEAATSTADYARQYKRGDWIERNGSPEAVAEALLAELEAEFAKVELPRRQD